MQDAKTKILNIYMAITFLVAAGFILADVKFAKIGIPLALQKISDFPQPALYIFELYLLTTLLFAVFFSNRNSLSNFAKNRAAQLTCFLILFGGLRALPDLLASPLLVVRNSSFVWYLLLPLFFSLIPIPARTWEKTFKVLLAIPLLMILYSVIFLWMANPADVSPDSSFIEYTQVKWALAISAYGAFAYALTKKGFILSTLILIILALALGQELAEKITRTNLLGFLLTSLVVFFHIRKNHKMIALAAARLVLVIFICISYAKFLRANEPINSAISSREFFDSKVEPNQNASKSLTKAFVKSERLSSGVEAFRYYMLHDAWAKFMMHPILGIGFKEQVVHRFYGGEIEGFRPNDGRHVFPKSMPISGPHNSYLNAIVRMGLSGALFMLLHLFCLILLYKEKLYASFFALAGGALYAAFNVGLEGPGRSAILLIAMGIALKAGNNIVIYAGINNEKNYC